MFLIVSYGGVLEKMCPHHLRHPVRLIVVPKRRRETVGIGKLHRLLRVIVRSPGRMRAGVIPVTIGKICGLAVAVFERRHVRVPLPRLSHIGRVIPATTMIHTRQRMNVDTVFAIVTEDRTPRPVWRRLYPAVERVGCLG
jgi:hypothetical protein